MSLNDIVSAAALSHVKQKLTEWFGPEVAAIVERVPGTTLWQLGEQQIWLDENGVRLTKPCPECGESMRYYSNPIHDIIELQAALAQSDRYGCPLCGARRQALRPVAAPAPAPAQPPSLRERLFG